MKFPEGFVWGSASSAYQTEGAPFEDGKGASIWDSFTHRSGTIFEGDTGDFACDGYHRFEQDIALMAALGIKAYRFSVSWPRVDPKGDGEISARGLDYYEKLVACCEKHGIAPYVTLYHWDLPQALEDRGGWENRETCYAFARYCALVAARLRGRVKAYFTLNEIQCAAMLGYEQGLHAPGKKLPLEGVFQVWHHLLLAHGLAFRALREIEPEAEISLASTGRLCYPQSDTPEDLAAAREMTFRVSDDDWLFTHQMALDPIVFGCYPEAEGGLLKRLTAAVPPEDMALIKTGINSLALNIYNGSAVRAHASGAPEYVPKQPGCRRTALKWPVTPEVMEFGPLLLFERYHLPVMITENGVSCNDFVYPDGKVHDGDRIDFLAHYLGALKNACARGVPVSGYFHWSFTDNFEWHSGYGERMGLVFTDYVTQKRIPKDSAGWYARCIAENGLGL